MRELVSLPLPLLVRLVVTANLFPLVIRPFPEVEAEVHLGKVLLPPLSLLTFGSLFALLESPLEVTLNGEEATEWCCLTLAALRPVLVDALE